jgi:rod shape-determining protein MreD
LAARSFGSFAFLLMVAVLQSTIGPRLSFLGGTADAVLVVVVCRALIYGTAAGMVWGFLGGLSLDLLSGAPMGTHALAMTLLGYVAGIGQRSPFHSRFLVPLATLLVSTVAYKLLVALTLRMLGWPLPAEVALLRVVALSVLANAFLMPFVYWLLLSFAERRGSFQTEF